MVLFGWHLGGGWVLWGFLFGGSVLRGGGVCLVLVGGRGFVCLFWVFLGAWVGVMEYLIWLVFEHSLDQLSN